MSVIHYLPEIRLGFELERRGSEPTACGKRLWAHVPAATNRRQWAGLEPFAPIVGQPRSVEGWEPCKACAATARVKAALGSLGGFTAPARYRDRLYAIEIAIGFFGGDPCEPGVGEGVIAERDLDGDRVWDRAQVYADQDPESRVYVLTPEGHAIPVAPSDEPIAFGLTIGGAAGACALGAAPECAEWEAFAFDPKSPPTGTWQRMCARGSRRPCRRIGGAS